MKKNHKPSTAAEALLMRLKLNGIDYLFGNAGTDFAPIIEAYANRQKKNYNPTNHDYGMRQSWGGSRLGCAHSRKQIEGHGGSGKRLGSGG